ncbi:hypothetical protein NDU88_000111, partial [Pleurodeles waltl]
PGGLLPPPPARSWWAPTPALWLLSRPPRSGWAPAPTSWLLPRPVHLQPW